MTNISETATRAERGVMRQANKRGQLLKTRTDKTPASPHNTRLSSEARRHRARHDQDLRYGSGGCGPGLRYGASLTSGR